MYTLSDATRSYLAQLQEPLLIRGYFSAATHPLLAPLVPQLRDLLQEYAVAGGSHVHVEFVDPHDDPAVESEAGSRYGIRPVPFQVSNKYQASVVNSYFDVLISYGDQFQVLSYRDLIDVKSQADNDLNVELKNPEYAITSAIRKTLVSYQGSGGLFDTVREPLSFTGYLSQTLPSQLQTVRSALDAALAQVQEESGGKFKVTISDPGADPALAAKLTRDYGFRPMVVSLTDNMPFWFYMTLGDSRQTEQIPLPESYDQAGLKSALEAAIKRFSPGFLKTVAVMSPQNDPQMAQFGGGGASFSTLRDTLSSSVRWLDTDLKSGQVPADADLLMVLDPEGLETKQVFAIDQFLMQGGTIVLATAPTDVTIGQTVATRPINSGLEPWLAGFGVSFGKGLVLDTQSGALPIPVERNVGGYSVNELELAKYPYIVDVRDAGLDAHSPITSSLGQIDVPWATPVLADAGRNAQRKLTQLLHSSRGSWVSDATDLLPDYTAFPDLGFPASAATGTQPLALMLEGEFDSFFKGKPSPLLAAKSADAAADNAKADNGAPKSASKSAPGKSGGSKAADAKKPGAEAAPVSDKPAASATAATLPIDSVIQRSPDSARLIVLSSSAMFTDPVINLIGQTLGTRYTKSVEFVQNIVDWTLEDQGLLSIRSREHFARTLAPMNRKAQQFWEYLNYALVIGALAVVWVANRQRRRRAAARHQSLLQEV